MPASEVVRSNVVYETRFLTAAMCDSLIDLALQCSADTDGVRESDHNGIVELLAAVDGLIRARLAPFDRLRTCAACEQYTACECHP